MAVDVADSDGSGRVEEKEYTVFVHSDAFYKILGDDVLESGQIPTSVPPAVVQWDNWSCYARHTNVVLRQWRYG